MSHDYCSECGALLADREERDEQMCYRCLFARAARIIAQMWDDVTVMRPIVEAVAASRQPSARRTQARRCLERHVSAHPAPESEA